MRRLLRARADCLGGSGANVGVFNTDGQPAVKPRCSKAITVSSGVANGMLIEKHAAGLSGHRKSCPGFRHGGVARHDFQAPERLRICSL